MLAEALEGWHAGQTSHSGVALLYVYPAFVALINAALGERVGLARWIAVGAAVAGCWLTIGGAPAGSDSLGIALALASGISFALYVVAAAQVMQGLPALESTAMIVLGAGMITGLAGLVTGSIQSDLGPSAWILAFVTAVISSSPAMMLFLAGTQRLGASRAALIATVEPMVTVVAGYLALGDGLTALQVVGASLILGAVLGQHAITVNAQQ